ncbi:MAG: RraA family protein [Actinobacteria bacterium]|nr:RraA family protein [Actinomycetota bacterium]
MDTREEVKEYEERLWGLIPTERITRFKIDRPSPTLIAAYKELEEPTPTLADILDGMGINGIIAASVLRPVVPGKIAAGPAVTLRYMLERRTVTQGFADRAVARMADRDAYAVAEPGDLIVMDCDGEEVSCMGGLSTTVAVAKGLAGCVVYGGVRDVATMRDKEYPVWSAHITPRSGKYRIEAAEINGPITVAGVQVRPGDLVVADDSGIVVVPLELTEEVLRRAQEAIAKESRIVAMLASGATLADMRRVLPPSRW